MSIPIDGEPTRNRARAQRPLRQAESAREEMQREPIRDRLGREVTRKRHQNQDKFEIPAHLIERGWTYEWKRFTTFGQEDRAYMMGLEENGWTPVPADRHPQFMGPDHKGFILRDGMILMERPEELTRQARMEEDEAAREEIRIQRRKNGETPSNQLDRSLDPRVHRQRTDYNIALTPSSEYTPAGED